MIYMNVAMWMWKYIHATYGSIVRILAKKENKFLGQSYRTDVMLVALLILVRFSFKQCFFLINV